jgi:hypothetical protein
MLCVFILRHLAYGVKPSTYFYRPSLVPPFISYGIQNIFRLFFFKFTPAGENAREVEFTSDEYDVIRRVAVLAKTLDED